MSTTDPSRERSTPPSATRPVRRSPRMELSSLSSAAIARAGLRQLLATDGVSESTRETAVLLANELAINALLHSGGPAYLEAAVGPRGIRIEVTDPSRVLPQAHLTLAELDERGRGLLMVSAMASRWGTDPLDVGKTVWCEIDLR